VVWVLATMALLAAMAAPVDVAFAQDADLSLAVSDAPDPVSANGNVTYTITVTNNGPDAASNVQLTSQNTGLWFVSLSSPGGWLCNAPAPDTAAAPTVNCTIASLPVGVSVFTLVATASSGVLGVNDRTLQTAFDVTSTTFDPNPGDEHETETTAYVTPDSDLVVNLSGPASATAGGQLTYTLTTTNNGPEDAPAVLAGIGLDPGLTFVSAVGPTGGSCVTPAVGQGGSVDCSVPLLETGDSITLTVVALDTAGTTAMTFGVAISGNLDPDVFSNQDEVVTTFGAPAPQTTGLSPSSGPTAGGTSVTISGSNLTGATLTVDGATVTPTSASASSIVFSTPAHAAGAVNVVVTTAGGTDTETFTYVAAPQITLVSPSSGTTSGGSFVTITGTNFTGVTAVKFGLNDAASFSFVSTTSITAATPAGVAGGVAVSVTTPGGTATSAGAYTYVPAPQITSLSLTSGPTAGGTDVVIAGANFGSSASELTAVKFGGVNATSFLWLSTTQISATTPAGSGAADVAVTIGGSTVTSTGAFTYIAAPQITSLSPNTGPAAGETSVTITGVNLTGATLTVDGATVTPTSIGASSIVFTTPAHAAGTVNVTVTTAGGTDTETLSYVAAPQMTGVSPSTGSTAGGTNVTISGSNLTDATLAVDGATVTPTSASATSIVFTTPAHAAGAVDVTVTTAGGSDTEAFTYDVPLQITSVSPNVGPASGGTVFTITGQNLTAVEHIFFVNQTASITARSATSITATTPALGTRGTYTMILTVPGQASVGVDNAFTFVDGGQVNTTGVSDPVDIGDSFDVTFTVTNDNTVTLEGVSLSWTTPAGLTFVSATPSQGSVSTLDATLGNLAAGASATVTLRYTAASSGTYSIAATPSATNGGGPSNGATASVTVSAAPAPQISAISPTSGLTAGGTNVTITGQNFTGATAVTIGGVNATSFNVDSATSISAVTPAHAAGSVAVAVTTPSGTATVASAFNYDGAPQVTSVSPNVGPASGGTVFTVTGENLTDVESIFFVNLSATITARSATSITAITPALGTGGTYGMHLIVPGGASVVVDQAFTFVDGPHVSAAAISGPVSVGDSFDVTFTVTNNNTVALEGVSLSWTTPAGLTFVSATPSQGSASTLDATLGNLAAGESATVTLRYTAASSGTYSIAATPSATNGGPGNGAVASVTVDGPAEPAIEPVGAVQVAYNSEGKIIPLTISGDYSNLEATLPTHGAITFDGTTVIYVPTTGYSGPDSFTVTATAASGASAAAVVNLTVLAPAGPAPVLSPITRTVENGVAAPVDLTGSASGGPFTDASIVSVEGDTLASAVLTPSGSVGDRLYSLQYTSTMDTARTVTVTYTLSNRFGASTGIVVYDLKARVTSTTLRLVTDFSTSVSSMSKGAFKTSLRESIARAAGISSSRIAVQGVTAGLRFNGAPDLPEPNLEGPFPGINARVAAEHTRDEWFLATAAEMAGDSKAQSPVDAPPQPGAVLEGPLKVWVGGSVTFGRRKSSSGELDLDILSSGIVTGVDFKPTDNSGVGVSVGYSRAITDMGDEGSRVEGVSWTSAIYGGIRPVEGLFVSGVLGAGRLNLDVDREIEGNGVATGKRDAGVLFGGVEAGFERSESAWSVSSYGRLEFSRSEFDAFTETGGGFDNLSYAKMDSSSLQIALGARGQMVLELRSGIVTPRVMLEVLHEFDEVGDQTFQLADWLDGPTYLAPGQNQGHDRVRIGLGNTAILQNGWSVDVEAEAELGRDQALGTFRLRALKSF